MNNSLDTVAQLTTELQSDEQKHESITATLPTLSSIEMTERSQYSKRDVQELAQQIKCLRKLYGLPATYASQPAEKSDVVLPAVLTQRLKATNTHLPEECKIVFKQWYDEHKDYPFPNKEQQKALAAQANLTQAQVNRWFTNARNRSGFNKDNPHIPARGKKRPANEVLAQEEVKRART